MTYLDDIDYDEVADFNSHAHVERDLPPALFFMISSHFNSHAHVERDVKPVKGVTVRGISTHTLTWSVTIALPP